MRSSIYRGLYQGLNVFALGRFYNDSGDWGGAATVEEPDGSFSDRIFNLASLAWCGSIFQAPAGDSFYDSHGQVIRFRFPAINSWREDILMNCPATPEISKDHDFFNQLSFCFEMDGCNVWLPKLELAGRLFFHHETLIKSAFFPSGIDSNFCIYESGGVIEIYAHSKIGVESWLFDYKPCRDHLGWLLTNKNYRDSFDSIWKCLNQERLIFSGGSSIWGFNFTPPTLLHGVDVTAMGYLSQDKKNFLIWEIVKLEIPINIDKKLVFHHPDLVGSLDLKSPKCVPRLSPLVDCILFDGRVDSVVVY